MKFFVPGRICLFGEHSDWAGHYRRINVEAEKGGFYSYAAGVAYQVLTHYHVRGLEIDNYQTDLPIKKGLSSSAAICVLVARAFNRIYDLKMTVRDEMEYAYLGEISTPSILSNSGVEFLSSFRTPRMASVMRSIVPKSGSAMNLSCNGGEF